MIKGEHITKTYGAVKVLHGVSLNVTEGSIVSIVGSSGAGKSTLLHILGTLEKPDAGKLSLDGVDVSQLSAKELARFRNINIGFIFQFHHLLPELTALENAALPAYILGVKQKSAEENAKSLLNRLGLGHRLDSKPGTLSGGEQQRVALARALINNPKILLADEPTGNLDQENADEVLKLLLELRRELNITTVIVTHDMNIASRTEKVMRMKDGIIDMTE